MNIGVNMSLLEKLKKNSTIKDTAILANSKFFNAKDVIQTPVPMINVALSGRLDGGLVPGLTVFAGPSKHFKTAFALLLAKSYMEKYNDSVVLFYDSEFGSPQSYFDSFGIDTERVIHTPITDIEQLKHDAMAQLSNIERGEHVIVIVDSVGNLASRKEVEDALDGKSVADMSRAKQLKSLFRMVTPHLTLKDIPMIVVNHTYKEIGMYPKDIVSGGTGVYYSADNIYIIGRQQEKDGTELTGYNFIINVEKSRHVREKSKIPVEVSFEGGISKWSGLLDVALQGGFVYKPSNGWYARKDEEQKYRQKDTYTKEFWLPILSSKEFQSYIESTYRISSSDLMASELTSEAIEEEFANAEE
jgi:RecA/RadA recombinase